MALEHHWVDFGREPTQQPNPEYPEGIDMMIGDANWPSCQTPLPYPAKRCGMHVVKCNVCGLQVTVTTAGRPDDPRSVKMNCLPRGHG